MTATVTPFLRRTRDASGVPPRVRWLVAAMSAVAVGAVAVVQMLAAPPTVPWGDLAVVSAIVTLAYVESVHVYYGGHQHRLSFSFSEVGLLVALVFLPLGLAPVAVLFGSTLYQLLARRAPIKSTYNVAQDTIATCVVALLLMVLPPAGPVIVEAALVSAALTVPVFLGIGVGSKLRLLRALLGHSGWPQLRLTLGIDVVAALGSVSLGVLGIYTWVTEPALTAFALLPLLAVVLAYRATLNAQALARQREADAERLRGLVASASDGIVLVDEDGIVRVWNPLLESLTGIGADVAEGATLPDVMTGVTRVAASALGSESGTVATWRDGRVMEEHTSLVDVGDGRTGRVIVLRDITSKQQAEALKSDFVARVSHELRTPLTPLVGFIEVLRDRGRRLGPATQEAALDAMSRNARRMAAVVDELLVVVELDQGPLRTATAPIDVEPAARAARDGLREGTHSHPIALDIPPATVVLGDAERLTDVLGHLLDNAVRYTPPGTPIDVTTAHEDHSLVIRVRDRGPGIPTEAHDLVFERFSRLDEPLRMRTTGLGLGLFIARRLTEGMGGTLALATSDAQGTTMEIRLPAVARAGSRSGSGPEAEARGDGQSEETTEGEAAAGRRQRTA